MRKITFIISLIVVTSFTLTFNSCNNASKNDEENKVTLYYSNWAETIAMTKVTELALEEVGFDVESVLIEPGLVYAGLSRGDGDIFLESWLPQTHAHYWEKYGDKLDKAGISFDYANTGLVVPQYVSINSITELNKNKKRFNSKIIGIGSGSGVHKDTEKAIKEYNLDYDQITSSGPAMIASLQKAVQKKDWVVITGWKPHHKWAKYDLKYLEDPKGVYPDEKSFILTRKGFTDEKPGFKTFLDNFYFKEQQLYDLMMVFDEARNEETAAREWYDANKELIRSWMPEEWLTD